MANHPNRRGRGGSGVVPRPDQVVAARGNMSQSAAAAIIYTTQARWSLYETGGARMHPAAWELFKIKTGEV